MQPLSKSAEHECSNTDPLSSVVRLVRQQIAVMSALITLSHDEALAPRAHDGAPASSALDLQSLGNTLSTTETLLTIVDTHCDERFNHPTFRASIPSVRFLAACPLRTAAGELLGLLWLLHDQPRELDSTQQTSLLAMAEVAAHWLAQERMIAQQATELEALRSSERRMALAIDGSGTGVWDRDIANGAIYYSDSWKSLLGYAPDDISNRIEDSYTRVHPDDVSYVHATIADHLQQRTAEYQVEHRLRCKDGTYKWVHSRGMVVERDAAGQALRMLGTTTDITAKRAMSDQVLRTVDLLTDLTNEIPGMAFQYCRSTNGTTYFNYVSAGVSDLFGITPEQLKADPQAMRAAIYPHDLAGYLQSFEGSAKDLSPWHHEYRVQLCDGTISWCQGDARPKRLADGTILWHGFIADISPHKSIEAELQVFATTDSLTQLANRRWFIVQLEAELSCVKRSAEHRATLLMLDLDHFKKINDEWGHAVGDQALRHFAKILRSQLRQSDTAGRLGGEEFAVVLSTADIDKSLRFAERLQQALASTPLIHDDQPIYLAVSIGIAAMDAADSTVEAVVSRSDAALYRAKRNGRNRIECCTLALEH